MPTYGFANVEYMTCPFNKNHYFPKTRLQHHIIKCARKYPQHFTCPFNGLHRFLTEAEYKAHVGPCSKEAAVLYGNYPLPAQHGNLNETPIHDYQNQDFHFELENWNEEYKDK